MNLSVCVCVCVFVCLAVRGLLFVILMTDIWRVKRCIIIIIIIIIISSELHVRYSPNLLCMLPMAVARSSSGGVVVSFVLPVLRG